MEQTGAGAVLHSHSQAATLLSQRIGRDHPGELLLEGLEMLKGLEGITTHASGVAVPVLPNDQNLGRLSATARPLLAHAPNGLLIAGHGLYAWGHDLATARRHLEILEFLLEQRWRDLVMGPDALRPTRRHGIDHVLLDIEGTTCPVSFVSDVLFPYAAQRLEPYLQAHSQEAAMLQLLDDVRQAWQDDATATAAGVTYGPERPVVPYLLWLISVDRKLTPLKELQGLIWEEGYASGALQGPLFADVAPALRRWKRQGLGLSVYSSGSVAAQKLLYGHSDAGDLRELFDGWFDTRTGAKQAAASYAGIASQLTIAPDRILFISDSNAELQAAREAGMQVLLSNRRGNGQSAEAGFEKIESFSTLQLSR